jgi:ADP-ribose pyrophosphatase YjhB (NUDIX family)
VSPVTSNKRIAAIAAVERSIADVENGAPVFNLTEAKRLIAERRSRRVAEQHARADTTWHPFDEYCIERYRLILASGDTGGIKREDAEKRLAAWEAYREVRLLLDGKAETLRKLRDGGAP